MTIYSPNGEAPASDQKARRRVLILCYAFPPANHVASMRGVRIGRAFAKRGWDVHVLKSDYHPSPSDLDVDVSAFSVHGYRPGSLSRLLARASATRSAKSILLSLARRLIPPDYTWLMRGRIAAAVERIGGFEQFDCVVSTASPFVLHAVCEAAKKRGECFAWLADSRDMWAGSLYRRPNFVPVAYQKAVERRFLAACDRTIFASESTAAIYAKRHGIETHLVLNGHEGDLTGATRAGPAELRRFVHTGTLYGGRKDLRPLLTALEQTTPDNGSDCELVLAGADSVAVASELKPTTRVRIPGLGQVSRPVAAELQNSADALVIAMADTDFDATCTPAKLFEYAFRNKPIIAIAREDSDAGRLIRRHNLGIASFDPAKIGAFIEAVDNSGWPGARDLEELTADSQFARFVDLAEQCLLERACE